MTNSKSITLILTLLLTITLACGGSPTPTDSQIATGVAATLDAATAQVESVAATLAAMEDAGTGGGGEMDATAIPDAAEPAANDAPPSGLRVVYLKDGEAWAWYQQTATPTQITFTESGSRVNYVLLSDDGQLVAYTRVPGDDDIPSEADFNPTLWAINIDGSGERILAGPEQFRQVDDNPDIAGVMPHNLTWMPNTHALAYGSQIRVFGPGAGLPGHLNLIDVDTGNRGIFLKPGEGGDFYYAPNASQLALVTPTSISLMNTDGTNRRDDVLTYDSVLTYSEYQYHARPVWAPDSSGLVVAIPPADPMAESPNKTAIWRIPLDGSPAVYVTTLNTAPFFGNEVAISPLLDTAAYFQETDQTATGGGFELRITNLLDGSLQVVHTAAQRFDGWAPDAAHFIFTPKDNPMPQIGTVGGGFIPLANIGTDWITQVQWIDAQHLTFFSQRPGTTDTWDLYLASLDGDLTLIDTLVGVTLSADAVLP